MLSSAIALRQHDSLFTFEGGGNQKRVMSTYLLLAYRGTFGQSRSRPSLGDPNTHLVSCDLSVSTGMPHEYSWFTYGSLVEKFDRDADCRSHGG